MAGKRDNADAFYRSVMRHTVGSNRADTRRAAKAASRGQPAAVAEAAKPAEPKSAEPRSAVIDGLAKAAKPFRVSRRAVEDSQRVGGRKRKPVVAPMMTVRPYQPAPGVLPANEKPLAFDSAFGTGSSVAALDGWGWGGGAGQAVFAEGLTFLGYAYLSELTQRPEYRRISERIATEMSRRWIELQATGEGKEDKLTAINNELNRLGLKDVFRRAAEHDGFFGRGHVYLDFGVATTDATELATPVGDGSDSASIAKVGPTKRLKAVRNIEPIWCYPAAYNANDPLAADWYRPNEWFAMAKRIHRTRLLCFVGREVPDLLKPAYAFGGLSMSQMAKPYVDNWLRTRQAVSDLVESFSVSGIYTNMSAWLQEGGDDMQDRIDIWNNFRSNSGTMLLDKNTEEFFNVAVPLGTLDALQAQSQEQMSSVSGIPLVVLLGITPTGLNASSEGEMRAFYDMIQAFQESLFRPHLTTIINFVQLSLFGAVDPEITFSFVPLWAMNEKESAEIDKLEAEADQVRIDSGVISQEEARTALSNQAGSRYSDIDPAEVPDLPNNVDAQGNAPGEGGEEDGGASAGEGGSGDEPEEKEAA